MLTTILAIVTFLLLVVVAVFMAVVSSKQFELSQANRARIRALRSEDREVHSRIDDLGQVQHAMARERQLQQEKDRQRFATESLHIGEGERRGSSNGGGDGAQLGTKRPYEDSMKNRGVDADTGLHLTDREVNRYASLAVSKLWSADGVMLDGKSCLENRNSNDAASSSPSGEGAGKICFGKISDGLDIIGRKPAESYSSRYRDPDMDFEKELRKVYVHDFLRSQGIDTDLLRVRGGASEHNPAYEDTVLASKKDGKNHIRGDTEIWGDARAKGAVRAQGHLACKGGKSDLNSDGLPTSFADPDDEGGRNVIRGDTRVRGHLKTAGTLRVRGDTVLHPGKTDVDAGDDERFARTVFGENHNDRGANVIRGDTHMSGHVDHHGDSVHHANIIGNKKADLNDVEARKLRLADDTEKNNMVFEAGRTSDGKNEGLSSINFNGQTKDGHQNFDASKMRWRLGADQRGEKDRFFLDRFGGGDLWTPLKIQDGQIRLQGDVRVCDAKGENCKKLKLQQQQQQA